MTTFSFLLLQGSGNAGTMNLVFLALIFGVFYFFLIRPQNKRQREQRLFLEEMEKGDEVVTSSGMIGRINQIDDDVITLEVGNKQYIRITKGSVSKELTEAFQNKKKD